MPLAKACLFLGLAAWIPGLPLSQESREFSETLIPTPGVLVEGAAGNVDRLELRELEMTSLAASGAALIRFEGLQPPPDRAGDGALAEVELVGGGRVFAELAGGDGEFLNLRLVGNKRLRLAIEEFQGLRIDERFPASWTEAVEPAEEGDRLYRVRGGGVDRIDGTIESFTSQSVTLDTALGAKEFPWEEVAALFIEAFEEEFVGDEGELVVVDLVDGSRLPLYFKGLTAGGLDLVTRVGSGLRLPLEVVAEVLVAGSGIEFLSELEPSTAESTSPFGDDLGMVWPVRKDRCTTGSPLRAGGRIWTRGIGVHAPSRIVYDLDGEWKSLRGRVAIDDEVISLPARGSARFRIKNGESLLWESPLLRGGDMPVALPPIDLQGVRQLVLEVDMADEMHVGDRADWLRLILAR